LRGNHRPERGSEISLGGGRKRELLPREDNSSRRDCEKKEEKNNHRGVSKKWGWKQVIIEGVLPRGLKGRQLSIRKWGGTSRKITHFTTTTKMPLTQREALKCSEGIGKKGEKRVGKNLTHRILRE